MMRSRPIILISVVLLSLSAGYAQTPWEKDYQQIYAPRLAKITTPLFKKDFVEDLLAEAWVHRENPPAMMFYIQKAVELAKPLKDNSLNLQAHRLMAKYSPDHQAANLENAIALHETIYKAARNGFEKAELAGPFVDTLLLYANYSARLGDRTQAYRWANRAALISGKRNDLKIRVNAVRKRLPNILEQAKTIESLRGKIKANPNDVAARTQLIKVYIVDLDDADAAAELLRGDVGEALRSYVPLARLKPSALSGDLAFEMAQWYAHLMSNAAETSKPLMADRVNEYTFQFLKRASKNDPRQIVIQKLRGALPAQTGGETHAEGWAFAPLSTDADSPEIEKAVKRAVVFLKRNQRSDGLWGARQNMGDDVKSDVLIKNASSIVCGLIAAGEDPRSPYLLRSIRTMSRMRVNDFQSRLWRCTALSASYTLLDGRYGETLREDVKYLLDSTNINVWGWRNSPTRPLSEPTIARPEQTYLALLALGMADRVGVAVPRSLWMDAIKWWQAAQLKDGGWNSMGLGGSRQANSNLRETAYGVYGQLLCNDRLGKTRRQSLAYSSIRKGLARIEQHLKPDANMNIFTMLAMARIGSAMDTPTLGKINWLKLTRPKIINHQTQSGSFAQLGGNVFLQTGRAVLCLERPIHGE